MTTGCLVMAYGTPGSIDDVAAYYTHIRRGNAPSPELVDELIGRYEAIGGTSPLRERTDAQAAGIEKALGDGWEVARGDKHASPFIEDGVTALAATGVDRIVGVVLAPHFSKSSIGEYASRLDAAAAERSLPAVTVEYWHDVAEWLSFQADAVRDALDRSPERTKVLFTAHSLPERVLVDDPYVEQLHESAAQIAARVGLNRWADWSVAWQSAGRTSDVWRGPDILEVLGDLAETGRADGVVVCPQGFTSDSLEVLYDLDIRAANRAAELGLAFIRTRSVNDDDSVLAALAERVRQVADS